MTASGGQPDLGAVLGFSADELARNRTGQLSARQHGVLQTKRRSGFIGLIYVGVFAIGFAIFAGVYLIPKLNKQQHGPSKPPFGAIVYGVLGLIVVIMVLSALRTRRRLDKLGSGSVHEVLGPARTRVHHIAGNVGDLTSGGAVGYGGGIRLELTIGKTMFFIPTRAMLDAFQTGGTYRVYYATGGHRVYNTILSAERVG
jgi:uncharacterized membrane protein YeaQ/YmgE (transglycosylase-associated protein family)